MTRNILRLLVLLLTPLWLSLAFEALGLRLPLPALLSSWLGVEKETDPAAIPPPGWRESTYLAANPDVAAAVRGGLLRSGYDHYQQFGRAEGRPGVPAASAPLVHVDPVQTTTPQTVFAPTADVETSTAALPGASALSVSPSPEPAFPVAPKPGQTPTSPQARSTEQAEIRPPPAVASEPPSAAALPPPVPTMRPDSVIPEAAAVKRPTSLAESPTQAIPKPGQKPTQPPFPTVPSTTVGTAASGALVPVSRVRAGADGKAIRLVLDLDGSPPHITPPTQRKGERLDIDLPNTLWKTTTSGLLPGALSYRVEPLRTGVNRLVLSGKAPMELKAFFTLPPEQDRGHRLVIDLVTRP